MLHFVAYLGLLIVAAETPQAAPSSADREAPAKATAPILVDWIHANDFSMIGLQPGVYKYHVLCGFHRAFGYLESRGAGCEYVSEGPLTLDLLKIHKLLFINLVSAEREPFLVSEIQAICEYVAGGGSLFVITDHSNAYFHAHQLKPLLTALDIRSSTTTACDEAPNTLGEGHAWITVTRFKEHPVTAGLRCIALQTGGCVDSRDAVAMTSENSWADEWSAGIYGDGNGPGFLGDLERNPEEVAGPLGVVLAKNYQKGRILIASDQNMFADAFLNYADNYRLWLNGISWLLRDDALRQPDPYVHWKPTVISIFEQYDRAAFGDYGGDGFYHALALINRYYFTFATDHPLASADLLIFARNDYELKPEQLDGAVAHLKRGRNLLMLSAEKDVSSNTQGVVGAILRRMTASDVRPRAVPNCTRWEIPGCGRIDLMPASSVPDNSYVPSPKLAPDEIGIAHGQQLLDAIRDALPPSDAGPRNE